MELGWGVRGELVEVDLTRRGIRWDYSPEPGVYKLAQGDIWDRE